MANLTSVISLRDNYSAVLRQASRHTASFQKDVNKARQAMDAAYNRERTIRTRNAPAWKAINDITKKMQSVRDRAVTITARTQHFMGRMQAVSSTLWRVTKSPYTVAVRLKDGVSTGLGKIRSSLSFLETPLKVGAGFAAAGVVAAGAGMAEALKGAAELERFQISMEHFIGVNNKKMSKEEVKKKADDFIIALRKNADETPFETGEVIKTGTRAVGIAGGDTKQAMSLVKLSEDMAALTPGKTLEDAIEAIADLMTGETERMKEFGFKISQEQIKAAGGKMENIKNDKGLALTEIFKGGSTKLSTSASGLWSTISGSFKSGITNMGIKSLEILKPQLQKWADFLSSGGADRFFEAGSKLMAKMFSGVVRGVEKAKEYLSKHFIDNPEFQKINTLSGKVQFAIQSFKDTFDKWYASGGKEQINNTVDALVGYLSTAVKASSAPFKQIGIDIGKPIASGMLQGMKDFAAENPGASALMTFLMTPGPIQIKAAAAAGVGIGGEINSFSKFLDEKQQKEQTDLATFVDNISNAAGKSESLYGQGSISADDTTFFGGVKNAIKGKYYDMFGYPEEYKPKAIGMPRVPRDNYPALLHQNEAVLTAQEAEQYRSGEGRSVEVTINLNNPVVRDDSDIQKIMAALRAELENVTMNMG
ncbi:hypothetical protein [Paenibacillus tyrfis]|uniref:Phage tail tape measure protein domain-containing protein n=1 Tax=Paenibacillus tyrfis TaxID=1501230 RepID=A0A081P4F8_9BACL|nr:hypothetical protein [Paenibacillus tyrfis]KEQ25581.1 hypothetical protein ET33_02345 [Paenibacillus tyrfis]